MSRPTSFALSLLVLLVGLLVPKAARAERDLIVPFHEGGRLVLDQLSGVRASAGAGVSYAGPLGVSFHSASAGDAETKTTRLWLAPSADVFVTDHLSLGGLVDVSHSFGSTKQAGEEVSLPGTTSLSVVPRVGFYVPAGDRFGVWPRLGVGYTRTQSAASVAGAAPVRETFQALLLEADLALVYRFDETFFLRGGPSLSVSVGGRREQEGAAGVDGNVLSIGGVVAFGVSLDP